jgi:formylglycine-generating enzyme
MSTHSSPTRGLLFAIMFAGMSPGQAQENGAFTNSLGMKMVRIDPGTFHMGSAQGGDFDERPAHPVRISRSFFMAATEISNRQYEEFDPAQKSFRGKRGFSKEDDEAVVFVSWHDAVKFCEWLSRKEGKNYRLPTEAEWEYACRAGTATSYATGDTLPEVFHKHQKQEWDPVPVALHTGQTPANPWGLHDLHGNVEEWCLDWHGAYDPVAQVDPVGPARCDFKVTRGGSHNTPVEFLRSANRSGTLPHDKHWLIGFRIVQAELPSTPPRREVEPPLWARNVEQSKFDWAGRGEAEKPFFSGPKTFVFISPDSNGPLFSRHNHQPAITACPNGDLLAIWYSCQTEAGRELGVVASRLRRGAEEWEPAAPFWDAPDRNDHGNALWWDGRETLHHFNGLSTDGTWAKLALVQRTSTDNGATWSEARLIDPEHQLRNQVIAGAFQTREGHIIVPCDAVPGGNGGTAIHVGYNGGERWEDPGASAEKPNFAEGEEGGWIAGIHAGVVELKDGRLMALGRGDSISGQMPKSVSVPGGQAAGPGKRWRYSASGLPPIGGGQRLVLLRLKEGPLFLASFASEMELLDSDGIPQKVSGLFGALSFDEGETWPVRRLITDGGPERELDGGGNTRRFKMSATTAEPRGYLAATQTPDEVIHLISSKLHYRFNLAWLKSPLPSVAGAPVAARPGANPAGQTQPQAANREELEKKFEQSLSGVELVGRWRTVEEGKLGEEKEERYRIQRVTKVTNDTWVVAAQVQYGKKDVTVPIPVQVFWAGDTPVISLTDLEIPNLGKYSARVMIFEGTYGGTWSGRQVRGFVQGVIRKAE